MSPQSNLISFLVLGTIQSQYFFAYLRHFCSTLRKRCEKTNSLQNMIDPFTFLNFLSFFGKVFSIWLEENYQLGKKLRRNFFRHRRSEKSFPFHISRYSEWKSKNYLSEWKWGMLIKNIKLNPQCFHLYPQNFQDFLVY